AKDGNATNFIPSFSIRRHKQIISIMKPSLLVLSIMCMAALQTTAQTVSPAAKEIAAIIAKYDAVGTSVVVVKDNEIVYNQSFGLRDRAIQEPLENDDVFRIASISKSFVATCLMQLVEAGKLSLDDDVGELIGFPVRNPNFPDSVISLRMVMSHTSSISDKNGYFTLDAFNPEKNPDWTKAYNDYAPGGGYEYCNLNFNLAGAILEKHSGERFDEYVHKHVIEPLGLYAGYNVDDLDSSRFAVLYAYDGETKQFEASPAAYRSPALQDYQIGYSA